MKTVSKVNTQSFLFLNFHKIFTDALQSYSIILFCLPKLDLIQFILSGWQLTSFIVQIEKFV